MRKFIVDQLPAKGNTVSLSASESKHLLRVNRAKIGQIVRLVDRNSLEANAIIVSTENRTATLQVEAFVAPQIAPHPLHLFLSVVKGAAMDLAIRNATETGVTHIHPVLSERSIATGDRHDRWEKIVTGAVKQCQRTDIPTVLPLIRLQEALSFKPEISERYIAIPSAPHIQTTANGPRMLLIGPEGGLSSHEIQQAQTHQWIPIGIARFVLRAETAVAVAVAQLSH